MFHQPYEGKKEATKGYFIPISLKMVRLFLRTVVLVISRGKKKKKKAASNP